MPEKMTRPTVPATLMAGVIATLVMTPLAYLAPAVRLPDVDFAAMLGALVTGAITPRFGVVWLIGMLAHMLNGAVIFPLVYTFALYRVLPGPPPMRGALWGMALWLILQAVVMPLTGAGVFSAATSSPWGALIGSAIAHLIYGSLLGWLSSPGVARRIEREKIRDAA